jgi:RNA polymerase sigma-70 factor (ECF subfamily)
VAELSSILTQKRPILASPDLEAKLRTLVETVHEAWPEIALDDAVFVAHLGDRLPEDESARATFGKLHAADLYLACACARQVPEAVAAFERDHLSRAVGAVRRIDSTPDFVDEVRQRLRERLLVGSLPRIGEYTGGGPLQAWVRVAATRLALNTRRDALRNAQLRPHIPSSPRDPEIDLLNGQYRGQVAAAFRAAFTRLGGNDRELLRLHYVEGLSHEQIARAHQVERSTASRRIGAARRFILDETRRELERLVPAITSASRDSLLAALRSQVGLSLVSLLRQ